ncbi:hypothetical protein A2W24_05090 [Microgenomates group bacterium RBG_16_45_19]|nr:MAG: hypothetical protein A2W24_05090 [Microgenomates group bacterium RBG_16_45_19]
MFFEWDPDKSKLNQQKHGLNFKKAKQVFAHPRLDWLDTRKDYGEPRYLSIGTIKAKTMIIVAYTYRKKNIRLISARKANPKEIRRFYDQINKT